MSYAAKRILNSNNNRRQSIKFQIEVPVNMSYSTSDTDFHADYQYDNSEDHFIRGAPERRSIQLKKRHQPAGNDSLHNQTICFKISIDSSLDRNRNFPVSIGKASSIASDAPSSGYSSSMSNSGSFQCLDEQFEANNNAFCSNYPAQTPIKSCQNPLFCNENVYDRLSYSNKRRCSIASLASSSTESNSSSECDIYEEITNFTQGEIMKKQQPKPHTYCNEQLNGGNRQQLFKRREYTVNEIFQNAKCFRDEANKQEVNQMVNAKSVNILKQLFDKKKPNVTAVQSPVKVQKCAMILRKPRVEEVTPPRQVNNANAQATHVYVNEKISKEVIV